MQKYSIIWKHLDRGSEIGVRLKAKERFSLPYFIDGKEKDDFENKRPVSLNPMHLIKGLLVGYFDRPPGVVTTFAQLNTDEILTENLATFKSDSLENMILDFAAHLRQQNGSEASLQALMTGVELVPKSNLIKYDCTLDLYNALEDKTIKDRKVGIQKLTELLDHIDISQLSPEILEDYDVLKSEVQNMK